MAQQQNWQSYSYPSQPQGSKAGPALGAVGGGCAVLVGLIIIVAFFLPWIAGWSEDTSAFTLVKDAIESIDNSASKVLTALINGSSVLAGCGSVIFGLGLAMGAFVARRNGAFRAWMAASVGGMVILGAFWPCYMLNMAVMAESTDQLKFGFWLTLGGALFLAIPAFIGLMSAFMSQNE